MTPREQNDFVADPRKLAQELRDNANLWPKDSLITRRELAAADALVAALDERDAFRLMIMDRLDWQAHFKAPCQYCGYNGPNFYNSDVHKCVSVPSFFARLRAENERLRKNLAACLCPTCGEEMDHLCQSQVCISAALSSKQEK